MKTFLDCGRYDGTAIRQYCVDDSWKIYSFDVDPKKDTDLPEHELIKKAVWTEDSRVEISLDPMKQASHIKGMSNKSHPRTKKIESIDFSKFVDKLPLSTKVICSMDIEGAEFPVLRKMLDTGTISILDVLDVEFHHRFMDDETTESARKLIQDITNQGVLVRLKVLLC